MSGYIRQVNKRKDEGPKPLPGELVLDADRKNPTLGNPIFLHNHKDMAERLRVVADHRKIAEEDYARKGPIYQELQKIAALVISGKKVAISCWCHPKPCHTDFFVEKIVEMVQKVQPENPVKFTEPKPASTPEFNF